MNFFTWLRDGVRQAVLLGVSDAVDEIGTPSENDTLREDLVKSIESGESTKRLPGAAKTSSRTPRKRLGRSLKDVEANPTVASEK